MEPICVLSLKESAEFYQYEEKFEQRGIYFFIPTNTNKMNL